MAPNREHKCSCCGAKGHTVATCSMPGAQQIRALKRKLQDISKEATKSMTRRRCMVRPTVYKALAKQRSALYSGKVKNKKDYARQLKCKNKVMTRGGEGSLLAHQELVSAGYLDAPPKRCPCCQRGVLSITPQPDPRSCRRQDILYVRCNDDKCQKRWNVLHFTKLGVNIPTTLSCSQLRSALEHYTDAAGPSAPRASLGAKQAYSHKKTVAVLYDKLREIEAEAARKENKTIKLGGDVQGQRNIEGDGTLLRKMNVGA